MKLKTFKIGVIGKAGRSKGIPENLAETAREVGSEIAKNNCTLVSGGCMGVSYQATQGAAEENGSALWYSPAKNLAEHVEPPISYPYPLENTTVIYTNGSKAGRNVNSINESQGIIFIGGGTGTLNELTISYLEGKVVGILDVEGTPKEFREKLEKKGAGTAIVQDEDPRRLVQKVIEELKKKEFGPRKEVPITFKNEEGEELMGILHSPEQRKPPLVLMVHGFGGTKTDKKKVETARALREEGIACFRFDFAGCGDSEGKFKEMTVVKEVKDLNTAYKTALKQVDLDPERIALIGHSLGTVTSSLFVKDYEIPVKTMVFWSQGFNQKELFKVWGTKKEIAEQEDFIIQDSKKVGIDYIEENSDKDYSSIISELDFPILLLQGEEDEDVPPRFSEELASGHENVELKKLKEGDHKLNDVEVRRELVDTTVSWIKEHL